jgi:hypothetical protein
MIVLLAGQLRTSWDVNRNFCEGLVIRTATENYVQRVGAAHTQL